MTLLPVCSSSCVHSCLPNAHFAPSTSLPQSSHLPPVTPSDLPSSTRLTIQVEATRDFQQRGAEGGGEMLSVAVVPYHLQSRQSRAELLQSLLRQEGVDEVQDFACKCPRCQWEDRGTQTAENRQLWLETTSPELQLCLGNHYMQEGERGGGAGSCWQAAVCYLHTLLFLQNDVSGDFSVLEMIGMACHAWGAALLNMGDWFRARCIWLHAREASRHYSTLQAEVLKSTSYPFLRLKGDWAAVCGPSDIIPASSCEAPVVHVTSAAIISAEECCNAIMWAEQHAAKLGSWTTSRHYAVPTTDIPVHAVPPLLVWFNTLLRTTIGPLMHAQNTDSSASSRSALCVHDVFVCKYEAAESLEEWWARRDARRRGQLKSAEDRSSSTPQRLLPLHLDQSSHSFVLALNSPVAFEEGDEQAGRSCPAGSFVGGGTRFPALGTTVCAEAGRLVSFKGGSTIHGGAPVEAGVRYIIAGFLYFSEAATVDPPSTSSLSASNLVPNLLYGSDAGGIDALTAAAVEDCELTTANISAVVSELQEESVLCSNSQRTLTLEQLQGDKSGNYCFQRPGGGAGGGGGGEEESHRAIKKPKIDFSQSESMSFSFDF